MSDVRDGRPNPAAGVTCQVCGGRDIYVYTQDPVNVFLRCRDCGLVTNGSQFDEAELQEDHYDTADYFVEYEKRWKRKVFSQGRRIDMALHYVPDAENLLDLGCSVGTCLEAARRRDLFAVGIDISAYAVEYCHERGYDAQVGTGTEIDLDDESMDLVTAWNIVEHVPRTAEIMTEIRRVLRPGGVCAMLLPNANYIKARMWPHTFKFFHTGDGSVHEHQVYHTHHTITTVLERCGFERLPRPVFIRPRLRHPLSALAEILEFLPRLAINALRRVTYLEKDLLVIARAV
ncbi:MAG: class I SAM-dependent methyltransferase [Armatimonadota bacterium]